jgi:hypothetical protein
MPAKFFITSSADSLCQRLLQAVERDLPQLAGPRDVAIQFRQRFLHALIGQRAGRIVHGRLPQHAFRVDRDAGRITRADRAATARAAATCLSKRAGSESKDDRQNYDRDNERRLQPRREYFELRTAPNHGVTSIASSVSCSKRAVRATAHPPGHGTMSAAHP